MGAGILFGVVFCQCLAHSLCSINIKYVDEMEKYFEENTIRFLYQSYNMSILKMIFLLTCSHSFFKSVLTL